MNVTAPPQVSRRTSSPVLTGVGNLTRRELAAWWSTGRWRLHALLWTVILAGLLAAMAWLLPALVAGTEAAAGVSDDPVEAVRQFPELIATIVAVGVVLLTQGVVLDERRNGVLEWLLSKPLARPSVILAKFVGHGSALLVTALLVPWVAIHVLLSLAAGEPWSPLRSLAAVGALALVVLFHLAFVLLLSTLTASRTLILAVPIALIVGSDAVTGVWPELFHVSPWSLGPVASILLGHGELITPWPLVTTVGWTALLLTGAAVALRRSEL